MTPAKPLPPAERDYAAWLGKVERQVVLPLKWVFLFISVLHWLWTRDWQMPSQEAFGMFIFYVGMTAGEHYFFARDRVTPRQVRPFVLGSFLLDAAFITALVLIDSIDISTIGETLPVSDYFTFFILLVLRGFALFRTRADNIMGFGIASTLFLMAALMQIGRANVLALPITVQKLTLIWAVMLLTQVFIGLVNAQKAEELKQTERLVRSASLASLGELSAGVAHEINNPIGIIKTYADYLVKSVKPDDPLRDDYTTIRAEAQRCEEIVRRMLDFSNPHVDTFKPLNVKVLLTETVDLVFHKSQSEDIDGELTTSGEIPPVSGDAVQLRQAFMNILLNAQQVVSQEIASGKHGEDYRGRVSISLSRATGPRPPVRIEVHDNGPGIGTEEAEKAFEPFFTRRKSGTGLGLAITRRIIEAHSGSISIAPHRNGGTVVTITLPIAGEEDA